MLDDKHYIHRHINILHTHLNLTNIKTFIIKSASINNLINDRFAENFLQSDFSENVILVKALYKFNVGDSFFLCWVLKLNKLT